MDPFESKVAGPLVEKVIDAISSDDLSTVSQLYSQIHDVNAYFYHTESQQMMTGLHLAALTCKPQIIDKLISMGADIDRRIVLPSSDSNPLAATPLHLAIITDRTVAALQLIDAGCDINKTFLTSQPNILLKVPPVVKDLGVISASPLNLAIIKSNSEVVEHLIKCGCKMNSKLGLFRKTENGGMAGVDEVSPLQTAINSKKYQIIGIFLNLAKRGTNIELDYRTMEGITAIHMAIHTDMLSVVQALIDLHCDINSPVRCDVIGYCLCPLHMAVRTTNKSMCECLLEAGIAVNSVCPLSTCGALQVAVTNGMGQLTLTLLQHGADYTAKNKENQMILKVMKDTLSQEIVTAVLRHIITVHNTTAPFIRTADPHIFQNTTRCLHELTSLSNSRGLCILLGEATDDKDEADTLWTSLGFITLHLEIPTKCQLGNILRLIHHLDHSSIDSVLYVIQSKGTSNSLQCRDGRYMHFKELYSNVVTHDGGVRKPIFLITDIYADAGCSAVEDSNDPLPCPNLLHVAYVRNECQDVGLTSHLYNRLAWLGKVPVDIHQILTDTCRTISSTNHKQPRLKSSINEPFLFSKMFES